MQRRRVQGALQYMCIRGFYLLVGLLLFWRIDGKIFAGELCLPWSMSELYRDEKGRQSASSLVYCDAYYRCLLGRQYLVEAFVSRHIKLSDMRITVLDKNNDQCVAIYETANQSAQQRKTVFDAMLAELIVVLPPP